VNRRYVKSGARFLAVYLNLALSLPNPSFALRQTGLEEQNDDQGKPVGPKAELVAALRVSPIPAAASVPLVAGAEEANHAIIQHRLDRIGRFLSVASRHIKQGDSIQDFVKDEIEGHMAEFNNFTPEQFYHLLTGEVSPVESLNQAQIKLLKLSVKVFPHLRARFLMNEPLDAESVFQSLKLEKEWGPNRDQALGLIRRAAEVGHIVPPAETLVPWPGPITPTQWLKALRFIAKDKNSELELIVEPGIFSEQDYSYALIGERVPFQSLFRDHSLFTFEMHNTLSTVIWAIERTWRYNQTTDPVVIAANLASVFVTGYDDQGSPSFRTVRQVSRPGVVKRTLEVLKAPDVGAEEKGTSEAGRAALLDFVAKYQGIIDLLTEGRLDAANLAEYFPEAGLQIMARSAGYREGLVFSLPQAGLPSAFLERGVPVFVQEKWRDQVKASLQQAVEQGAIRFVDNNPAEAYLVIGEEKAIPLQPGQVFIGVNEQTVSRVTPGLLQELQQRGLLEPGSVVILYRAPKESVLIFA